ncbi:unnamed protein product [Prorocentrum cordatum]|uniref:Uncharacterized protein n=1 Tax=Prorocentrum cordatum TaxID=2364126 RepID=A0ABN9SEV5_9DINO|nr:unnamed protein product [Polarella glacialis]
MARYHGGLALVALCASCRGSLALEDDPSDGLSMVQVASVREASAKEATAKEDDRAPRSFGWPAWPWSRAARPPAQPAEQAPPAGAPGHSVTEAEAQATKSKLQSATNAAHVTRLARKAADASSEIAQRRAAEAGLQQQHTAGLNAAARRTGRGGRAPSRSGRAERRAWTLPLASFLAPPSG